MKYIGLKNVRTKGQLSVTHIVQAIVLIQYYCTGRLATFLQPSGIYILLKVRTGSFSD